MKLRIFFICLLILCSARLSAVLANDTSSFTQHLKTCAEYYGSQTIELNAIKLTTTKQILGFKGDKCAYKESISANNSRYTVNCLLSRNDLAELGKLMDDFEKDSNSQNIDLNDFTQVQSTSIVSGWSKYLQNPDICTIDIEQ